MSTLLAIDFGERRIGLAWASSHGGVPSPLATLNRRSDAQVIAEIDSLAREYEAERLVLGEPVDLQGRHGANCERVRRFAKKLEAATGLAVDFQPETLTTVAATERLRDLGIHPSRFKPGLDAMAATLMLEEFLSRRERVGDPTDDNTPQDDATVARDETPPS